MHREPSQGQDRARPPGGFAAGLKTWTTGILYNVCLEKGSDRLIVFRGLGYHNQLSELFSTIQH